MYITLTPAYGRDYKSIKSVKADYNANKDFIINQFGHPYDGKPINKSEVIKAGFKVMIRYGQLRKICSIN